MTHRGILLATTFLILMGGMVWWTWSPSPRPEAVLPTPEPSISEGLPGPALDPVDVPSAERGEEGSGPVVVEGPVEGWLTGTVVGIGGLPVPGADVMLGWHGPPPMGLLTVGTSGPDGSFSVDQRAVRAGAQLVLGAQHEGWRPATLLLPPPPEEGYSGLVLELRPGYGVEGQILRSGLPLEGARLRLTSSGEEAPRSWALPGGLCWTEGRLEALPPSAVTSEEGRFAFQGLAQGLHRLTIDPPGVSIPRTEFRDLMVPDPAVRIDLTHTELALTVVDQEGPLVGARIDASCMAEKAVLTSGPVRVLLAVPEGRKVRFVVSHPAAARAVERTVVAPASGERLPVEFEMERIPRPVLHVTVSGAAGLEIQHLRLRFLDEAGETVLEQRVPRAGDQDVFIVDPLGLDAATYFLELRGDREGAARFLRPQEVPLEVPESGRVTAHFKPLMNGCLDLGVTLRPGEIQRVDYLVRQGTSRPFVEGILAERRAGSNVLVGGSGRIRQVLGEDRSFRATDYLPPGAYEVEVKVHNISGAIRTLRRPLTLSPLETTSVDFDGTQQD